MIVTKILINFCVSIENLQLLQKGMVCIFTPKCRKNTAMHQEQIFINQFN